MKPHVTSDVLSVVASTVQKPGIFFKEKDGQLVPIDSTDKTQIMNTLNWSIVEAAQKWDLANNDQTPIWIAIISIVKTVAEAIEDLNEIGIKGAAKKLLAMTIIESIYDKNSWKFKVLGIPIPGIKQLIKKYVMKYASIAVDWVVDKIFNDKKDTKNEEC